MNHEAQAAHDDLVARIKHSREHLAKLDAAIGSLTEARYIEFQQLMADESALRTLRHYTGLAEQAAEQKASA